MVSLRIQPSNSNDTAGLSCLMGSFPLYYNCDFQLNNSSVFLDPLRWKNVPNLQCWLFWFCSLLTGEPGEKWIFKQRQGSPCSAFFLQPFQKRRELLASCWKRSVKEVSLFLGMNCELRHKVRRSFSWDHLPFCHFMEKISHWEVRGELHLSV